MDGRDTDPRSGKGFIEDLTAHCEKSAGKIASIIGRYYAMDRDKRWERVKIAYDLLVNGEGKKAADMAEACLLYTSNAHRYILPVRYLFLLNLLTDDTN